jgi:hypothetical protein
MFKGFPGRLYVNGSTDFIDLIDIDKFSVHELDEILEILGYPAEDIRYYHYLVPKADLDVGLRALGNDEDVRAFSTFVWVHKLMNVYIEHHITTVQTYFSSSPSKVIIEDINDEDEPNTKVDKPRTSTFKKLLLGWHDDWNVDDNVHVNLDSNVDLLMDQNLDNNVDLGMDHNLDNNVDLGMDHNLDNNVDLGVDNSLDNNVDLGVDQNLDNNVELGVDQNLEHSDNGITEDGSSIEWSSEDDSDFVEDNGNCVNDTEVDMRDFRLHTDAEVDINHSNDVDFVEAMDEDVLDNDLFDEDERRQRENESIFSVGQVFGTKEEVKVMIRELAVDTRRQIRIIKDESKRMRAICKGDTEDGVHNKTQVGAGSSSSDKGKGPIVKNVGGRGKKADPNTHKCPWTLLLSKDKDSGSWVIRTLVNEHKCLQSRTIYSCTATFLSKKLLEQLQENPKIPVKAVQEQFQRKFEVGVSLMKAFRAKNLAMEQIHGDFESQYGMLRNYVEELIKANPGTTVRLEVQPATDPASMVRKFKRIYVCLGSLKQGFKAIGRDLLGLDGAFLKGPFPGQILTAVGLDPNNGIYPLSYAIVEAETMQSWSWFLECIAEDLDLDANSNFTFMSDRQKVFIYFMSNARTVCLICMYYVLSLLC